jgi:hypothetical protein
MLEIMEKNELKLFIFFFIIYSLFVHWVGWDETSRFDLTRAIVEEKTINIDQYKDNTGDRAYFKNHYYITASPGSSFLSVPMYATYSFIYKSFFPINPNETQEKLFINETFNKAFIITYIDQGFFISSSMIILQIFNSAFFGAMLVILFYRVVSKLSTNNKHRIFITIILGLASPVLAYSTTFYGTIIATFLGFLSFYLLFLRKNSIAFYFLAGLVVGYSIVVNYMMIILAFALTVLAFYYNKKNVKWYLIGAVIGILPLLIYNYLIFGNIFELTLFYTDKTVWPTITQNVLGNLFDFVAQNYAYLAGTYRGLFFYYPVLIFSLVAFYLFSRKFKPETLVIIFIFISFLLFSPTRWWMGGGTFGPRYLLPTIPFLVLPLTFLLEKIEKNKFVLLVFILFFGISIFHNILSFNETEGVEAKFNYQENKWEVKKFIQNPIYNHYLPLFLKNGPRSRIVEGLLTDVTKIDIRDFKPMPMEEIKLFTLAPLGILVLKIPFLIIPILLAVVTLIWWKELFALRFKNIPVSLILLVLIILLFVCRLEFKNIFYDKNWYPLGKNETTRWMAKEANVDIFSSKEQISNFYLWSYYRPRKVKIYLNDTLLKELNLTKEMYSSPLILSKGLYTLKFVSEECDIPNLVENSSDIRCLAVRIGNFSMIDVTDNLIDYSCSSGWHDLENIGIEFRWIAENASLEIFSYKSFEANLTIKILASYFKPRNVEIYWNDQLISDKLISHYFTTETSITEKIKIKEGFNNLLIKSKEGCDIPFLLENSTDKRCLSIAISKLKFNK